MIALLYRAKSYPAAHTKPWVFETSLKLGCLHHRTKAGTDYIILVDEKTYSMAVHRLGKNEVRGDPWTNWTCRLDASYLLFEDGSQYWFPPKVACNAQIHHIKEE